MILPDTKHDFNEKEDDWGFPSFLSLTELHNPKKGFIVKDACIVGAEVYVCNSSHEKKLNQAVKLTISLNQAIEVEVLGPEPEGTNVETLSPFSKVGCEESAKQADAELVSAALGRVIYFLKTRKVKDMNDQACKELQILWGELGKFQFELTWLEPQVKYALGVKNYVEKALEAELLKENMIVLELGMGRLKAKSVAAEINLDVERDLLKVKGFKKIDLDSQLGCGS
jgi:hypothetical protein